MKANPDLAVNAVVVEFGKYMKIIVRFSEDLSSHVTEHLNAFEIFKQSQINRKRVPACVEKG